MPEPIIPDPTTPTPTDPGTPPSEPFSFANLVDDKGAFKSDLDWEKTLTPLGVQDQAGAFSKYKTVEELIKGHGNIQSLASGKTDGMVRLPKGEDDTQGLREFRKALGIPDEVSGYGVKKPDNVPDEQWSQENVDQYLNLLHKHNASPSLVKELIDLNGNLTGLQTETFTREQEIQSEKFAEEQRSKLEQEHGSTLNAVADVAHRAAQHFGVSEDLKSELLSTAEGVNLLHKMGKSIGEDNLPNTLRSQAKAAKDEAMQIMTDPNHPDHARYRQGDDFVVRKVAEGLKNG